MPLLTFSVGLATGCRNGATQVVAFNVVVPSINIKVWDQNANWDVTGSQVSAGNFLNFRIETNTYSVVNRPNYAGEGYVKIKVKDPAGIGYTELYQNTATPIQLTKLAVSSSLWYGVASGDVSKGGNTAVADSDGITLYKSGIYRVSAELDLLNHIKNNYKAPDGDDYTGKTVTALKTITIDPVAWSSDQISTILECMSERIQTGVTLE